MKSLPAVATPDGMGPRIQGLQGSNNRTLSPYLNLKVFGLRRIPSGPEVFVRGAISVV